MSSNVGGGGYLAPSKPIWKNIQKIDDSGEKIPTKRADFLEFYGYAGISDYYLEKKDLFVEIFNKEMETRDNPDQWHVLKTSPIWLTTGILTEQFFQNGHWPAPAIPGILIGILAYFLSLVGITSLQKTRKTSKAYKLAWNIVLGEDNCFIGKSGRPATKAEIKLMGTKSFQKALETYQKRAKECAKIAYETVQEKYDANEFQKTIFGKF